MKKLYAATLAAALAGSALMVAFNTSHKNPRQPESTPSAQTECFTPDNTAQKQFGISENPEATAGQAYLYHARAARSADGTVTVSSDEIRYGVNGNADTKVTKTISFGANSPASASRTVEDLQANGSWKNNPAFAEKGAVAAVFQRDAAKTAANINDYTYQEYLQPAELVLGCRLPKPRT